MSNSMWYMFRKLLFLLYITVLAVRIPCLIICSIQPVWPTFGMSFLYFLDFTDIWPSIPIRFLFFLRVICLIRNVSLTVHYPAPMRSLRSINNSGVIHHSVCVHTLPVKGMEIWLFTLHHMTEDVRKIEKPNLKNCIRLSRADNLFQSCKSEISTHGKPPPPPPHQLDMMADI